MGMRGHIKFVDSKTGLWGFVIPEDGSDDVHFRVAEFSGPRPTPQDVGLEVEFELCEDGGRRHAGAARLVDPPERAEPSVQPMAHLPGHALTN
jgi:cold shock CspA family protein